MAKSARKYHHGDLRRALLDGALEALESETLETLSLRKVARQIGVSHNAPYMHFADKEALFVALADEGFEALTTAVAEAIREVAPGRDQVIAGCGAYVEFAQANPARMQVMFRPLATDEIRCSDAAGNGAFGILEQIVESAQEAGAIAPGPAAAYAHLLWSLVHGVAEILRTTSGGAKAFSGQTDRQRITWMVDQVLEGLRAQDPLTRAAWAFN